MSGKTIADSLREFFSGRGFRFNDPDSYIRRLLSKEMGKRRLAAYDELLEQKLRGAAKTADQYAFFKSSREVNLAFSFAANLELAASVWLAEQFDEIARDGWRVGELGCSVGVLTSWLSTNYPSVRFSGYDVVDSFLEIANSETQTDNLSFVKWNYKDIHTRPEGTHDCLLTSFGIDFESADLHHATHPDLLRESEHYLFMRQEAETYLRSWRGAIVDGGYACCVLRIPDYPEFLAVADAAHECGWSLEMQKSDLIHAGGQSVPGLMLKAEQSKQASTDELRRFWVDDKQLHGKNGVFESAAALLKFEELGETEVLDTGSKYYDGDGHSMVTTVGRSAKCGFSFSMATTGYVRLELTANTEDIPAVQFDWQRT
jgi:hypothetical protein